MASLPQKGRIGVQIAAEAAGQKQRLEIGNQSPRELFLEIGVGQRLLFPLLPALQNRSAAGVVHEWCNDLDTVSTVSSVKL